MKRRMIFEPAISGHVLEWLHHLYCWCQTLDDEFVFVLPQKFDKLKKNLTWECSKNIQIVYLSEKDEKSCISHGLLRNAWNTSWVIRKYARKENVTEVFLIFFMKVMPFLLFLLPAKCSVSGVLYRIYLRDSSKKNIRLFFEKMRFFLISKSQSVKKVLVLNDAQSVRRLNDLYKTDKFQYLCDPIPRIDGPFHDLRNELGIPKKNKVFFSFGSIDERKSPIEILEACSLMSTEEMANITLIFSGRVSENIRAVFFEWVEILKGKIQIFVMESFLPFERLNDLCYTSDCILTIYKNVCQSSGSIGYAAFFGKYVISPASGLLGELVKEYNLGITLDLISPKTIKDALCIRYEKQQTNYCVEHTLKHFCEDIFDA